MATLTIGVEEECLLLGRQRAAYARGGSLHDVLERVAVSVDGQA